MDANLNLFMEQAVLHISTAVLSFFEILKLNLFFSLEISKQPTRKNCRKKRP